jgi:hypothetical protein
VTCILIARQRLYTHIPAEANARNSRTSITRKRRGKDASLTIEAVFSVRSVPRAYKRTLSEDIMGTSPAGLGPKNDCAGEDQQQL